MREFPLDSRRTKTSTVFGIEIETSIPDRANLSKRDIPTGDKIFQRFFAKTLVTSNTVKSRRLTNNTERTMFFEVTFFRTIAQVRAMVSLSGFPMTSRMKLLQPSQAHLLKKLNIPLKMRSTLGTNLSTKDKIGVGQRTKESLIIHSRVVANETPVTSRRSHSTHTPERERK